MKTIKVARCTVLKKYKIIHFREINLKAFQQTIINQVKPIMNKSKHTITLYLEIVRVEINTHVLPCQTAWQRQQLHTSWLSKPLFNLIHLQTKQQPAYATHVSCTHESNCAQIRVRVRVFNVFKACFNLRAAAPCRSITSWIPPLLRRGGRIAALRSKLETIAGPTTAEPESRFREGERIFTGSDEQIELVFVALMLRSRHVFHLCRFTLTSHSSDHSAAKGKSQRHASPRQRRIPPPSTQEILPLLRKQYVKSS